MRGWKKRSGMMPRFLALATRRMLVSFTEWEEQGVFGEEHVEGEVLVRHPRGH